MASGHLARSDDGTFDTCNDEEGHALSSVIIGAIVFACLFATAVIRMLLHMRLPIHHLDFESKEGAPGRAFFRTTVRFRIGSSTRPPGLGNRARRL